MSHYIEAVICNTSGGSVHHYTKRFQDKTTFDGWVRHQDPANGGHCTVVKWWRDRPPCDELTAIKRQYAKTWMTAKPPSS